MKRQNPSIFNDIIGPIMVGPSSSHTCGPARIGFLSSQLLRGNLKKAVVEFAREGAYTNMYKGQKTDLGFTSGLLGNRPEDPKLRNAHLTARKMGIDIQFKISDFEAIVPNISRITLTGDDGEERIVQADSTGGGTVKLLTIDNLPVSIVGDAYELLVFANTSDDKSLEQLCFEIKSNIDKYEKIDYSTFEDRGLVNVKLRKNVSNDLIEKLKVIDSVVDVNVIEPVLAVLSNVDGDVPFKSANEMLAIAEKEGKELWELALMYEKARSGWEEEEIIGFMKKIIKIMEDGIAEAMKGDIDMSGILKPTSGKIAKKSEDKSKWLSMGVLDIITPWSIATMEYSSAMGVVLCAPTGGSAGVIPGVILGTAKSVEASEDDKVKAMLATAIIGVCMAKDCNFSAELYGCQVEPGAASAMAAGGLMHYMGGTVGQALDAASVAIQNILGIICDPVAGLVQVPCISRNASASANAVVSANIIMGGFDACIPLDESTETMFRVGAQLPSELRCTCNGGLCLTPTGCRLAEEQDERDAARQA
ncbi:L-serine dehydratase [Dethiosulfatibacter aminovorans DSM 17477]|uniref:L-serine ammonia-lyase n=1 Tax=Dethiosulfatibacter aminovorans DSM 17477 TaxID=1121476 RepID=A0A1M6HZ48_9FIRM|nr:L-serine ammonia-lyase, iron-sulfur-dependent, subunit alpha [Dethiosulfatibacter aminovorans]SHJ27452.1 L-serine dehydratase [Dethiosulfatibacter aminovorans DSM 17477]